MALGINFEQAHESRDSRRGRERHCLHLEIAGKTECANGFDGVLRDLSRSGFLLETVVSLNPANEIEIALPHAGLRRARIAWSSGRFHGCRFIQHITKAAVSAALLRAPSTKVSEPPQRSEGDVAEESFGARLKRLRTDQSISQAAFARALGVSKPSVWKWETDSTLPRHKRMSEIARLLGVSLVELEHGTEESFPKPSIHPSIIGRTSNAASASEGHLRDVTNSCKANIAECAGVDPSQVEISIRF